MHVLVVGSSVIDLFLSVDQSHVEIQDKKVLLSLGDKIPSQIKKLTLGGNGSNASVGLTRLEIPTTFYTYLGNDVLSREIESGLTSEGVALMAQRDDSQTSMSLIFDFDSDRIIFSNHIKREHNFEIKNQEKYDYIYLHSIGEEWEGAYKQVLEYSKATNTPIAFSPGSKQIDSGSPVIEEIIKNSKIYFSNREEAAKILKKDPPSINELLQGLKEWGPEIISITDGAKGAYAIDKDSKIYEIGPSLKEGKEKTGAGDSYASAFFAAILHGQDVPAAMRSGSINAGAVMQEVGAQTGLLTLPKLDEELKNNDNLVARPLTTE